MKLFTKKNSSVEPEGSNSGLKRAITAKEGKRTNEDDNNEILSSPSVLSKAMVFDFTSGENREHKKSPSSKMDSNGNVSKDLETSKSPKSVRVASRDCLAIDGKPETMSPNLAKNRIQIDSPANRSYTPPPPLENEDSIVDDSKPSVTKSKILKGVTVKGLEKLQFNTQNTNRTDYTDKIATVIDSPNTADDVRTDRIRASIGSSPLVDRVQDPFAKKELSNLKMPIANVKILEDSLSQESLDQKPEFKKESFKVTVKPKDLAEKMQSPIDKPSNYMQIDVPAAKYKPPPPLEDNSFVIETSSTKSSPAVVKNKAKGITVRGIEKLQFDVSQPISLTDPTTSSADTKIIIPKQAADSKRQSFPVSIADTVSIPSAGIRETDQFIFDEFVVKNSSIQEDKNETDTLDKTPLISPVIGKNPFSSTNDFALVSSASVKNIQGLPSSSSTQFAIGIPQPNAGISKSSSYIVGNSGGNLASNSSQNVLSPKSAENITNITKSPSVQNTAIQKSPSSQNNVGISKSPSNQINNGITKSPSNQVNTNITKSPSNQVNTSITKSPSNQITINITKSPSSSAFKSPEVEPTNVIVNSKPPDAAILKREESFKHRKSVGSRPNSGIFDPPKLSDKSLSEAFKPAAVSVNILNIPAESQDTRLAISVMDLDSRKQSITSALSSHPSTANSSRSSVGPESARSIKNFQMQIDKPKMALYPPPLIEEESTPEDSKNKAPDFKMKGITVRGLENFHVDTKLAVKASSESELKPISPAIKSSSSEDEEGQTLAKQKKKSKPSLAKIPISTAPAPELVRENSDGPRTALISEIPNPFSDNYTGPDITDFPTSSTESPQQNRIKKQSTKERRNSKVAQYIADLKIDTIDEKPEIEKSKSNIAAWLDSTILEVKESKASLASPKSNQEITKSSSIVKLTLADLYLLPRFMTGVSVAFDISISKEMKRLLTRHLVAYDGEVHEKIGETTTHYCSVDGKKNLDILLNFPAIVLVDSKWILQCHKSQCRIPESKEIIQFLSLRVWMASRSILNMRQTQSTNELIEARKPANQNQQSEYIRNLQQQIYLLELETRYMYKEFDNRKAGKKDKGGLYRPKSLSGMQSKSQLLSSSPSLFGGSTKMLNAPELPVENEEDEEEERENLLREIKAKEESLRIEMEAVKKEKNELLEELNNLKERYSQNKDALNGEIIATKQKYDSASAQVSHLTLSYERAIQEKEQLHQTNLNLQCEANALKQKIDEQLAIHSHIELSIQKSQALRAQDSQRIKELEQKLEELNVDEFIKQISDMQTKISRLMADLKCESLEKQALIDQQAQLKEAAKVALQRSSTLEQEIDTLKLKIDRENKSSLSRRSKSEASVREEQERSEQIAQLENQVKMLKINVETKDANIEALYQRIKAAETAALKSSENCTLIKEKHDNLEQLSMKRAHELVQLGQDKSVLQDELAECKNALDRKDQKIQNLTNENKNLQERLSQLEAESSKWTEFANIVDQVETTGANYLAMMQGIKSKLGRV
ncbi:hypothetical protein HDV06_002158 [Boothiomyces sp. JEL0866]|nr:hypothetical protein HDV06_002158 [Boothiomyces sp. JEL0866]